MDLTEQMLLEEISSKKNTISSISQQYNLPYTSVYLKIRKLIQDNKLDKKVYAQYKKESRVKTVSDGRQRVMELIRSGIPPMRIADQLGFTRQYIYEMIKVSIDRGDMTREEYNDIKYNTERKKTALTIEKEKTAEKLLKLVETHQSLRQIREILDLRYSSAIKCCEYLVSTGKMTQEKFDQIRNFEREKEEEERLEVVKKLAEDYKTMSMLKLRDKYNICLKSVQNYVKTAVEMGFIDKKEYRKIIKERKTYKSSLSYSDINEMRKLRSSGMSLTELSEKFNRCTSIINRHLSEKSV